MKFLIIEDNYVNSRLLQKILDAYGTYDVSFNGQEGLDMYEKSLKNQDYYDIIFLDIMMPEIDGFKVLTSIREKEEKYELENIKIVMTTALDDFQSIKTAFNNQCEAYLIKPITKDKIKEIFIKFNILMPT